MNNISGTLDAITHTCFDGGIAGGVSASRFGVSGLCLPWRLLGVSNVYMVGLCGSVVSMVSLSRNICPKILITINTLLLYIYSLYDTKLLTVVLGSFSKTYFVITVLFPLKSMTVFTTS